MTSANAEALEVLLPYQRRWLADDSKFKICEKSRRTGITWAEAAKAVLDAALAKSDGGRNHSYIGSGKDMAREFIDAAADFARAFDEAASEVGEEVFVDEGREGREITVFRIDFASGNHIQALSSRPSNLRGRKGNVTLDEAAFQPDLMESVKAASSLTMWGGRVSVISTHNGAENEFNGLLEDARAGRNDYSVHRIPLDEACAEGLYKRICEVSGDEWSRAAEREWKAGLRRNAGAEDAAAEEYDCQPRHGGGVYFSRALVRSCMYDAPVPRFRGGAKFEALSERERHAKVLAWCESELKPLLDQLDPSRQHCLGEDFGRTADLTVLAPLEIGELLRCRVPFMVELAQVPFRAQEQILFYICDRLPRLLALKLDSRGNGQYLGEQARFRYGARAEAVMPSQPWYLEHMPKLRAAFEDSQLLLPRHDDTLSDMSSVRMVKGVPKVPENVRTGVNKDRHGDAAVALCMAWAASLEDPVEYGFHRAPRLGERAGTGSRDAGDADTDMSMDRGFRAVRGGVGWTRGML